MPAPNDYGAGYARFTFQVQDDGGTANGGADMDSTPNTLTVDVISVNDAPSGKDNMIHLSWDTRYTFTAADFGFTDVDGNAFAAVTISALPAAGALTLGNAPIHAGQRIAVNDIAVGRLQFTPALQLNGSPYLSFSFRVQDDGGTANGGADLDATARLFTVHLMPAPDDVHAHAGSETGLDSMSASEAHPTGLPAVGGVKILATTDVDHAASQPAFNQAQAISPAASGKRSVMNASVGPRQHALHSPSALPEVQTTSSYDQTDTPRKTGVRHVIITLDELLQTSPIKLQRADFNPGKASADMSDTSAAASEEAVGGSKASLPAVLAITGGVDALAVRWLRAHGSQTPRPKLPYKRS
jgi:hypothetical protein